MRLPMLIHHFSTLFAMMFTVAAVEQSLDPSIYVRIYSIEMWTQS